MLKCGGTTDERGGALGLRSFGATRGLFPEAREAEVIARVKSDGDLRDEIYDKLGRPQSRVRPTRRAAREEAG